MSSKVDLETTIDIVSRITLIRGRRVLLDSDLAKLYGVQTKRLNEQVRRNAERFAEDFAFRLTDAEATDLRSQFATLDKGRGQHSKYRPWVFTEQERLSTWRDTVAQPLLPACSVADANCLEVPAGRFDVCVRYSFPRAEIVSGRPAGS